MKSITKVCGIAVGAALLLGIFSCSNGNSENLDDPNLPLAPTKETVATPVFSFASGEIESGTSVTISCATEGAKIYYTTDGTEPTTSDIEYTAAIRVTTAITIKAIAVKSGMNNSSVANGIYTIKGLSRDYATCVVGDFILKDGTILPKDRTPESGTVAAVIVRAAADGKPALGVGIVHDKSGIAWCVSGTNASGSKTNISALQGDKNSGYRDGIDSWKKLFSACVDLKEATAETIDTVAQKYPPFYFSRQYASVNGLEGDLENGWYLPTVAELYTIYENKRIVDASLSKVVGGSKFGTYWYWSCNQDPSNDNCARLLGFQNGTMDSINKTTASYSVCSVRTFN